MAEPHRPAFVHDYDLEVLQGADWYIPFRKTPRTDQGVPYLEDTTDYTATLIIRAPDWDGDAVLTATTENGSIVVGFMPSVWETATAYGVGQKVVPTALNGYVYEVTVAGTSHAATQPTWPTTLGNTVTDNTVTWRAETTDSSVANVAISVPATVTADIAPWSRAVYTLKLFDTFNHVCMWLDGAVFLRRETTYE